MKSLDSTLAALAKDPSSSDFIICYAADPRVWRDEMAAMIDKGDIDILLASVSTMDDLARDRRLFDDSHVTAAFNPNVDPGLDAPVGASAVGDFVNDCIARMVAGVPRGQYSMCPNTEIYGT